MNRSDNTSQYQVTGAASLLTVTLAALLAACSGGEPPAPERYQQPDALFEQMASNLAGHDRLEKVVEIDHSRLGADAGSAMPPSRVLIFSDPQLETELIRHNPLTALDLPLRVLAYESTPGGPGRVIYNNFEYLASRYRLGDLPDARHQYQASIASVLEGIAPQDIASFENNTMQPDGIISITSPYDFPTTIHRVEEAIAAQDDTVSFGSVDFQARALEVGIELPPATLILFGGPGPGARAMSEAPTLGLDAFCQKFLIWQDGEGTVHLSFNDLLQLARRQGVGTSIPLRIIDYRLNKVFGEALAGAP